MIDFPDPAHHTNLAIKDICHLEHFADTIAGLRRCIKFFSHSDKATHVLSEARRDLGIVRGLEKIGKTRFATIIHAAVAFHRCLPAMRECLSALNDIAHDHKLDIEEFTADSFASDLNQLIAIGLPFAKTILCLEATHSTAGDVFMFWCAIAANLKQVLTDKKLRIPGDLKGKVRAIFNARWKEVFEDGPTDAHLSAFYIHPGKWPLL